MSAAMSRAVRSDPSDFLVLALFVTGFVCGVFGFWFQPPQTGAMQEIGNVQRAFDALHSTLQLIVVNVDAEHTRGPLLSTARLLLPLSTSLFILSALLTRGKQWRLRGWLWLLPWLRPWLPPRLGFLGLQPLVLILGCGKSGFKLARYYSSGPMDVVGVDRNLDSLDARTFRATFPTLELEFTSDEEIRALPLRAANRIVVCTGDDRNDLGICRRLLQACATAGHSPPITVTFETPGVMRIVQFDPLLAVHDAKQPLDLLDLAHFSARLLFRDKPPHRFRPPERRFVAGAENPCHVALAMSPANVDTHLLHAVRSLVYCARHPLRVSVFTERAAECEARLRSRYPALFRASEGGDDAVYGEQTPLAQVTLFESSPSQINVRALRAVHRAQPIDVIYALGADDAETALLVAEMIKGADVLEAPTPAIAGAFSASEAIDVGARTPCANPRAAYVFDELAKTNVLVERFALDGWLRAPAPNSAKDTPEAFNDTDAELIHSYYGGKSGQAWDRIPEHQRWFNRYTADHARIKLALLEATSQYQCDGFDAALKHHAPWLARLEHRRYVCERMLDGWIRRVALGAADAAVRRGGRPKLNRYHLNPTLQAFDSLPEGERVKDDEIVHLLRFLRPQIGERGRDRFG